jgi:hypothetical protein
MKRLSKQQRVNRAIERMESAALELIRYAENYVQRSDETGRRRDLFHHARRYASSVDAVSRSRTRKISVRGATSSRRAGQVAGSTVSP